VVSPPFYPLQSKYIGQYLKEYLPKTYNMLNMQHRSKSTAYHVRHKINYYNYKYVERKVISKDPIVKYAYYAELQRLRRRLKIVKCTPLAPPGSRTRLPQIQAKHFNLGASAGIEYRLQGYKKKRDAVKLLQKHMPPFIFNILKKGPISSAPPCTIASRPAISNRDINKIRAIWVYPLKVCTIEGMFAVPLIKAIQQSNYRTIAWNFTPWSGLYFKHFAESLSAKKRVYLGIDFSSFDTTVPSWIIHDIFSLLYKCFNIPDRYKSYFSRLWYFITHYFVHTPFALDGQKYQKHNGIPSGSWFTNIVGSLVNALVSRVAIRVLTGLRSSAARRAKYGRVNDYYMGDDSFIILEGYTRKANITNLELLGTRLSKVFFHYFGLIMHPRKSEISRNITKVSFLGSRFSESGYPIRKTTSFLKVLLHPEKTDKVIKKKIFKEVTDIKTKKKKTIIRKRRYGVESKEHLLIRICSMGYETHGNEEAWRLIFHIYQWLLAKHFPNLKDLTLWVLQNKENLTSQEIALLKIASRRFRLEGKEHIRDVGSRLRATPKEFLSQPLRFPRRSLVLLKLGDPFYIKGNPTYFTEDDISIYRSFYFQR
jgi:hypothetical protein